jgi:hypothetical protein
MFQIPLILHNSGSAHLPSSNLIKTMIHHFNLSCLSSLVKVANFSKVSLSNSIPSGDNRSISSGFHPLSVLSVWKLMGWRVFLDFHGRTEYNVLIKAMKRGFVAR